MDRHDAAEIRDAIVGLAERVEAALVPGAGRSAKARLEEGRIALAERIYVARFGVAVSPSISMSGRDGDNLFALVDLAFRAADAFLVRAASERTS